MQTIYSFFLAFAMFSSCGCKSNDFKNSESLLSERVNNEMNAPSAPSKGDKDGNFDAVTIDRKSKEAAVGVNIIDQSTPLEKIKIPEKNKKMAN